MMHCQCLHSYLIQKHTLLCSDKEPYKQTRQVLTLQVVKRDPACVAYIVHLPHMHSSTWPHGTELSCVKPATLYMSQCKPAARFIESKISKTLPKQLAQQQRTYAMAWKIPYHHMLLMKAYTKREG